MARTWAGELKDYHFGDSRAGWNKVREEALKPGADLSGILALLESDATEEAKEEVCRILALAARPEAVPVLARLAAKASKGSADRLPEMALYALASIPGPEADQALASLKAGPDAVQAQAAARELERRSGRARAEDRKLGLGDLKRLEAELSPDQPFQKRTAALKALAELQGAGALPHLIQALKDKEPEFRAQAIISMEKIPGEASSRALGTALESAPSTEKILILEALGRHAGPGVLPLLSRESASDKEEIRSAAFRALADLGDPASLDGLARAAADGSDEAGQCLARIHGQGITEAMRRQVLNSAGKPRAELIRALARRKEKLDAAFLAEQTGSQEPELRNAAFGALALQGSAQERAAVLQALNSGKPDLREGALRALASWPNNLVLEDLKAIARAEATGSTERILALRGFIRLAGSDFALLDQALTMAGRSEEKRLALAAMGLSESPEAMAKIRSYLPDPLLKEEAEAAALSQAARVSGSDPEQALSLVKEVLSLNPPDKLREACDKLLKKVEGRVGFVTRWRVSEVYAREGKGPKELFDLPFAPESGGGNFLPLEAKGDNPGRISLQEALGLGDNRVAYLEARLDSEARKKAVLEAGSDDGIKIWLNGKLVISDNAIRGYKEGEDSAKVTLQKGENRLLVKVTQGAGEWEASVRLRDPDGSALKGLKQEQ